MPDDWVKALEVRAGDLEAIATEMAVTGEARDLTTLGRRLVRERQRDGRLPTSSPGGAGPAEVSPAVRLWDPAGEWQVGDLAIVACWERVEPADEYRLVVRVGSLVAADAERATLRLDGVAPSRHYQRAQPGSSQAERWRQTVAGLMAQARDAADADDQVEVVLQSAGEALFSQLLAALQADSRFVCLDGRWFLRDCTRRPSEKQVVGLAWSMLRLEAPQPTEALARLAAPPLPADDPSRFGLYLALSEQADLFAVVGSGLPTRWQLAGPPPGRFVARHAAYDPETYAVLCRPGQAASPEAVRRLWQLGLLAAVV